MIPKRWPKRMTYARESVANEMPLFILQSFLRSENPQDFEKTSWIIEKKCVYPKIEIKKITSPHPLGNQKTLKGLPNYGVFATEKIITGKEIGEYVGEMYLTTDKESLQALLDRIPLSDYSWTIKVNNLFLTIDAQNVANEMALINDYRGLSPKPNVKMKGVIHKGVYYFCYVTICDIQKGEELLTDYGEPYWKYFRSTKEKS